MLLKVKHALLSVQTHVADLNTININQINIKQHDY